MFYVGANSLPYFIIGVGSAISALLPTAIIWIKKNKEFKEKGVKLGIIFGKDILSSIAMAGFTILGSVLLNYFSKTNYLIPILGFLIAYLLIDSKIYKKNNIDPASVFLLSFISKIPVFALCYYIIYMFFIPRHIVSFY